MLLVRLFLILASLLALSLTYGDDIDLDITMVSCKADIVSILARVLLVDVVKEEKVRRRLMWSLVDESSTPALQQKLCPQTETMVSLQGLQQ